MTANLAVVAFGFQIAAYVLGLPALAVSLLYGLYRVHQSLTPPVAPLALGRNPGAALLALALFVRALGTVAGLVAGVGRMLFGIAALVSGVVLVYSAALWFTSRGLDAQTGWARWVGAILILIPTLISLISLGVVRGPGRVLALLVTGSGGYVLWSLWRGFAA